MCARRSGLRSRLRCTSTAPGASRPSIGPTNPRYHALLTAFGALTGVPVLINTSFNEQEPIVASPAHAIACFERTQMDVLVMGDFYVAREEERDAVAGEMATAHVGV